jgi:hypothetical protein
MTFTLRSVRVANGVDEEGMLVFDEEQRLVAVLTHLGDQYDGLSGHWYLEAGFGRLGGPNQPTYTNLADAQTSIGRRLLGK